MAVKHQLGAVFVENTRKRCCVLESSARGSKARQGRVMNEDEARKAFIRASMENAGKTRQLLATNPACGYERGRRHRGIQADDGNTAEDAHVWESHCAFSDNLAARRIGLHEVAPSLDARGAVHSRRIDIVISGHDADALRRPEPGKPREGGIIFGRKAEVREIPRNHDVIGLVAKCVGGDLVGNGSLVDPPSSAMPIQIAQRPLDVPISGMKPLDWGEMDVRDVRNRKVFGHMWPSILYCTFISIPALE
jgi:hypothetical protein